MGEIFMIEEKQNSESDFPIQKFLVYFGIWFLLNVGPMWWTIYSNKRSRFDPVRDKDWLPFARLDYEKWSYFLACFTHFFMIPRFIMGFAFFFASTFGSAIICIGSDPFKLPVWKEKICKFWINLTFRAALMCAGM